MSYQAESLPLSAQRLVNMYAEVTPTQAKSRIALFGTPALTLHQTVGDGPIRGKIKMNGKVFVVSGQALWRVESNGTATNIGVILGTGLVDMEHNGVQIAVLTGTGPNDLFMATETTVTPVSDPDYPGATSVAFLDGYFLFTRTGTGQFFISGSYDGSVFDPLEFATAEGSPDNLVRVIVDHREAWLCGEETTEVWYNSGNADFPFERASAANIERGIIAKRSAVNLDNTIFWVGDDRIVYRADGYTPRRISTHAIEKVLEDFPGLGDLVAFAYTQGGHAFYVLKKPGAFTFVYDVATGFWHERESHNRPDYRVSTYCTAFDLHLVGDDSNGNIYRLDTSTYSGENGETVICRAASPPIWAEAETAVMNNLIIDMEAGVGLTNGQGSDPQIMLRWSDDGGHTWSNEKWRSMGKIGEYRRRARWDRLGQFRGPRVLEISVSDPVKRVVLGAYSELERGRL